VRLRNDNSPRPDPKLAKQTPIGSHDLVIPKIKMAAPAVAKILT